LAAAGTEAHFACIKDRGGGNVLHPGGSPALRDEARLGIGPQFGANEGPIAYTQIEGKNFFFQQDKLSNIGKNYRQLPYWRAYAPSSSRISWSFNDKFTLALHF
jgi:hypothetical protein